MAQVLGAPLLTAPLLERLEAWMLQAMTREWQDGQWDCAMAPADWALWLTGQDPGADLRGTYDSPLLAALALLARGGMVRTFAQRLEPQGWRRTAAPAPGDIGVVRLPGLIRRRFGAVAWGSGWAIASSDGMLITPARALAIWSPPNG